MPSGEASEMMARVAATLHERTGRTLEEWVAAVAASGVDPLDQKAVRNWLKTEHGIRQNSQWAIADAAARAAGWDEPTVEQYIDRQYVGAKSRLRPIFDRLRETVESFGDDVRVEGRATYTPFVRARQFAAVAVTGAGVTVGLRFMQAPPSALLVPAREPGQATHKLSLKSADAVDDDVRSLLWAAYDQNG